MLLLAARASSLCQCESRAYAGLRSILMLTVHSIRANSQHDCRNNVAFQLTGSNMAFKVVEDIQADEEIFTHYGEHYFDVNNAGCLCATCQK
jgi:hypothetical protein